MDKFSEIGGATFGPYCASSPAKTNPDSDQFFWLGLGVFLVTELFVICALAQLIGVFL